MSWKAQEEEAEGGTESLKGVVGATGSSSWVSAWHLKDQTHPGKLQSKETSDLGNQGDLVTRSSMGRRIFSFCLPGWGKGKSREEPHWGRIISKRESELWNWPVTWKRPLKKPKEMNTAQRTDKTSWLCVKCWRTDDYIWEGVTVNAWVLHGTWDMIVSWVSQPGWKPHWKWAAHFLSSQGIFSTNPSNLLVRLYLSQYKHAAVFFFNSKSRALYLCIVRDYIFKKNFSLEYSWITVLC